MKSPKSSGQPKKLSPLVLRRVVGKSMQPTFRPGQLVLARRASKKVTSGAVVIVSHNRLEKIKRVQDIKDNKVFLIGDNPRASIDSRSFGWLSVEAVIGEVLWPRG